MSPCRSIAADQPHELCFSDSDQFLMAPAEARDVEPGWQARLRLGFRCRDGRTLLAERRRSGPLAVQRPFYPEGGACHVYVLHPPGGVVGGDDLGIDVALERGAQALLTTPGAGKFYRSAGTTARLVQAFTVDDGAQLEWLPQENILFPGAAVRMQTRFDLRGDARALLWEVHCLGRPAIGEVFGTGRLDSGLSVSRDGIPLLDERLRVDGETRLHRALLAGHPVSAMLVATSATPAMLEACRALLTRVAPDHAAVTLLDELLVLRYLGSSTERARKLFTAAWQRLRPALLGRASSMPRIWST